MEQQEFKNSVLPLHSQLLSYAQRLLNNREEAEEIVQEVFLKLWRIRNELSRSEKGN